MMIFITTKLNIRVWDRDGLGQGKFSTAGSGKEWMLTKPIPTPQGCPISAS